METFPSHKQADQNIMLKIPHTGNAFHYCLPAKPSHFRGQRISKFPPCMAWPPPAWPGTHRPPPQRFAALSVCYFSLTRSKMLPSSPSPAITPSQPRSKPAGPAPHPKPRLSPKTADTHAPTPMAVPEGDRPRQGTDPGAHQRETHVQEQGDGESRGEPPHALSPQDGG